MMYSLTWQDPILHRGVIPFSVSAPHKKGLGEFTGPTSFHMYKCVLIL